MDTIFGVPWFHLDHFTLIVSRLALNTLVISLLSMLYRRYSGKQENLFTFISFNLPIFFIVYLMSLTEISIGIGFGLFAIFTILRYRTETVSLKDMSYLFLYIAVAVFNALVTPAVSLVELLFFNLVVLATVVVLEKMIQKDEKRDFQLTYDNVENLKPENKTLLLEDLKSRTGFEVFDVRVKNIDLHTGLAKLQVFFEQPS